MTGIDSKLISTWTLHLCQIFGLNLHKDIWTLFFQDLRLDHESRHEPRPLAFAVVIAYSMATAWWFKPILRTANVSDMGSQYLIYAEILDIKETRYIQHDAP